MKIQLTRRSYGTRTYVYSAFLPTKCAEGTKLEYNAYGFSIDDRLDYLYLPWADLVGRMLVLGSTRVPFWNALYNFA